MPIKLSKRKDSPNWYARGTYLGVRIDESTRAGKLSVAEKVKARIEREIEEGRTSIRDRTFAAEAISYMNAGGEKKYLPPLLRHFGKKSLRQISQATIDEAAAELYPDAAPSTRNRCVYTPANAVLRHAGVNIGLRRPKGHQGMPRTRFLSQEEAGRLVQRAGGLRPLVIFLLYTGCRIGEALALRWQDIDLNERRAFVPVTKTGEARSVHLPPIVVGELEKLTAKRPFPWARGSGFYRRWRRIAEDAGVEDVTPHTLRHSFATWMRRYAGLDDTALLATKVWKDPKSVRRYSHADISAEARMADRLPLLGLDRVGERVVIPFADLRKPGRWHR